jgi:hypothetical protein
MLQDAVIGGQMNFIHEAFAVGIKFPDWFGPFVFENSNNSELFEFVREKLPGQVLIDERTFYSALASGRFALTVWQIANMPDSLVIAIASKAAADGNIGILERLLPRKDLLVCVGPPAARNNHLSVMSFLNDNKIRVNFKELRAAATEENAKDVLLLLDRVDAKRAEMLQNSSLAEKKSEDHEVPKGPEGSEGSDEGSEGSDEDSEDQEGPIPKPSKKRKGKEEKKDPSPPEESDDDEPLLKKRK